MKLKLLPAVLCRTPVFSYQQNISQIWEELKDAIKNASPDLYEVIKETTGDQYTQLPAKIKFACWKYFNRACFRATPFGAFGSVTIVPFSEEAPFKITISNEVTLHQFIDWKHKDFLTAQVERAFQQSNFFLCNTSAYTSGSYIRYINLVRSTFELATTRRQEIVESTLTYCIVKQSKQNLMAYLTEHYRLKGAIAEDFIKQLIDLQLLITDVNANIIGDDYFQRIKLTPEKTVDDQRYIISEKKLVAGCLSKQPFKIISEAILCLKDHLPLHKNKDLETFKYNFSRKFEYLEVPLLMALDPEIGIGYGALETASTYSTLLDELKSPNPPALNTTITYGPLQHFILNKIIHKQKIRLEEFVSASKPSEATILPNTFSAIVQLVDNHIIVKHIGGSTANALLGRFTLANEKVNETCRDIVLLEEQANPEVLFFDIGYQAEKTVDNVNRRKCIYNYELPILSWPETTGYLSLNDIMVSVRQNEIILRSKKYNKRIIPRLASAYNYSRSDLSVYRFFCDLQHQHIQTNLNIHLKDFFPSLDYYPRIYYKNLILSPRMWKVPEELYKQTDKDDLLLFLTNWLKVNNIPQYFKCGNGDQMLCFNMVNSEDLNYFINYCLGKKYLYITEAFLPERPSIQDEKNQPYLEEYIVSFSHSEVVYEPTSKETPVPIYQEERPIHLPGNEWLYFEIYSHTLRSNQVLTALIDTYLQSVKKLIKNWFFIRYPHPAPHIRLRLQLKSGNISMQLIKQMADLIESYFNQGIVSDWQIKPYIQEIERYGVRTVDEIQRYFCSDSKYVLKLLRHCRSDQLLYGMTLRFINDVLEGLGLPLHDQRQYIQRMADSFASEMSIHTTAFKKINKSYISLKDNIGIPVLNKTLEKAYHRTVQHLVLLLSTIDHNKRRQQLMVDIVHMHINRLFPTDQRMHELVIYQYHLKYLLAKQKRVTSPH
ncbi:lantibiotic dehydratase [Olivibacter sp. SDN3]|uniref:lantibiotic dehydratase n=1 Tax=Olivibacter sp. SDN3 TaxID=2764720 RepID=UPI001651391E|nr:lantibiotic dehydratase [Olivibacter sp. SDN3]QNL50831.1 lantibiotic dehydratase [Olivibacter sp. SDN3]